MIPSNVEAIRGKITGTGAYRGVSIKLKTGGEIWAYPVIGVPTANMMQDVAQHAHNARHLGPYLVYDHTGITKSWLMHSSRLDKHVPEVNFLKVSDTVDIHSRRAAS